MLGANFLENFFAKPEFRDVISDTGSPNPPPVSPHKSTEANQKQDGSKKVTIKSYAFDKKVKCDPDTKRVYLSDDKSDTPSEDWVKIPENAFDISSYLAVNPAVDKSFENKNKDKKRWLTGPGRRTDPNADGAAHPNTDDRSLWKNDQRVWASLAEIKQPRGINWNVIRVAKEKRDSDKKLVHHDLFLYVGPCSFSFEMSFTDSDSKNL